MTNKRRLAAVVFAAVVLIAAAASVFVIAHEADHECIGDNCPVCAVITLCQNTLKTLGETLVSAAAVLACAGFAGLLRPFSGVFSRSKTPVSLKVKLLN